MAKSLKLDIFHRTLREILSNHFPDYRIGVYFNIDCSSVSWLSVSDRDTQFKVAEAIAVEKFTSRDDAPSLLIIDYVNSDSRRYLDIEEALSYMQIILKMASDRKAANKKSASTEKQGEEENTINLESLRDDVIKTGVIDPNKCYLVTGRRNGKMMYYHAFLRYLFGLKIKDVIFNDPATVVFWEDGEKTIVQCQNGEPFDPEKGLAMAISKKVFGNKYSYYGVFKKWVGKYNKKKSKAAENDPVEFISNGHRYVRDDIIQDLVKQALNNEESVPDDNPMGRTVKFIREVTGFNDYLNEQLKDPNFKKQYENTEVIRPYCDINKPEDNNETNE